MKGLLQNSIYIITDSGGTSREAYFLKKKSLIIMDNPFWQEIIEEECSLNTAAVENNIVENFKKLDGLHSNFSTSIFGTPVVSAICEMISAFLIDY